MEEVAMDTSSNVTTARPPRGVPSGRRLHHRLAALTAVSLAMMLAACGAGDDAGAAGGQGTDSGGDDPGETYEIVLSTVGTEDGMMNGTNWWADEVERRTDGRVTVDIVYDGALVSEAETLPAIRDGRITAGWMAGAYAPDELSLWEVIGIPFETKDSYAAATAFYEMYQEEGPFRQQFHEAGAHVLHFIPHSQTMIGMSEDHLRSPQDLQGKRLRAVGYISVALDILGAEPQPTAGVEIYENLQRGILDGYGGFPFDTVVEFSLHEVAPYTNDLGVGHYASNAILINLDFWEELPDDLRATIQEVTDEVQYEVGIEELHAIEEKACARYLEGDAPIYVWPEEDTQQLRDQIGDQVFEAWLSDAVATGVSEDDARAFHDDFLDTYEQLAADSPYESRVENCEARVTD